MEKDHYDYFIFGHRHLPIHIKLNNTCEYLCIGDWIVHFTFAEFDGNNMCLKTYPNYKTIDIIKK